jgi:NADPH2:quinone reductase
LDGHKGNVVAAARGFAPDGIDIALLTAGGEVVDQALAAVRDGGRVAHPNGVMPLPKARPELRLQTYDVMPNAQLFKKLNQLIQSGPFEVHVARIFSLEQAAEAQRALDQHYLGKLALRTS